MYVELIFSIRTVVPKTDHKQHYYLPTRSTVLYSITDILSGYIICVVQMLSQVTVLA